PWGSWHAHAIEHFANDVLGGQLLRFRLVGQKYPMPEDVHGNGFHVLRSDVGPPLDKSVGTRGRGQSQRGSRRGPVVDEALQVQLELLGLASCLNDVDDVLLDLVVR